jgi:DNA topoisomerase I
VVRACQELPGQRLFQYEDEAGDLREVTSTDINEYLREASGLDVSAKDFRTWAGTLEAALAFQHVGVPTSTGEAKQKLRKVLASVAARLGNTVTICRKCYVHPNVIDRYLRGEFALACEESSNGKGGFSSEETAVLALLIQARKVSMQGEGWRKSIGTINPDPRNSACTSRDCPPPRTRRIFRKVQR